MPQGGILATGSWDKTLKVRVYSFIHPTQFVPGSFRFPLFPSTWSLTLVNTSLNQVLGPPIARSLGYCGSQGTLLCYGCTEPGAPGRDRGPTNPDI